MEMLTSEALKIAVADADAHLRDQGSRSDREAFQRTVMALCSLFGTATDNSPQRGVFEEPVPA